MAMTEQNNGSLRTAALSPVQAAEWHSVVDAVATAVLVFDGKGALQHANQAAKSRLGPALGETATALASSVASGSADVVAAGVRGTAKPLVVDGGSLVLVTLAADAALQDLPLRDLEQKAIEAALQAEGGHVARAARRLGVPRSTLYEKLKRFGIARGA
jgi:DNA-binding NtrC family response regulator